MASQPPSEAALRAIRHRSGPFGFPERGNAEDPALVRLFTPGGVFRGSVSAATYRRHARQRIERRATRLRETRRQGRPASRGPYTHRPGPDEQITLAGMRRLRRTLGPL